MKRAKETPIHTAYEAFQAEYDPDYVKAVPNLPVRPHHPDLDHDVPATDEAEHQAYLAAIQTICLVCGNVFTPWPDRMKCSECGARLAR